MGIWGRRALCGFKLHFSHFPFSGSGVHRSRSQSLVPSLMGWGRRGSYKGVSVCPVPNSSWEGKGVGSLVLGAGSASGGEGPRSWLPPVLSPTGLAAVQGWSAGFGELTATVVLAFLANVTSGNCSGALSWIIILTFSFFNKHLFPEKANPILFFF